MVLYVMRHGECLAQSESQHAADPDTWLSDVGIAQVRHTATLLATAPITHILTSPLRRALQTATLLADQLSISSVAVWPALREMWDLPYDGPGRDTLQMHFPTAVFDPSFGQTSFRYGGDDHLTMRARSQQVLQRLISVYAETSHLVIVSHGFAINYLIHGLLAIPPSHLHWFDHQNGSVSIFQLRTLTEQTSYPGYPLTTIDILMLNAPAHLRDRSA